MPLKQQKTFQNSSLFNSYCTDWLTDLLMQHLFAFNTVTFLLSEVMFIRVSFMMPSKDRVRKEAKQIVYEMNKDTLLMDRKEKYIKDDRSKHHGEDYYEILIKTLPHSHSRQYIPVRTHKTSMIRTVQLLLYCIILGKVYSTVICPSRRVYCKCNDKVQC